MNINVIFTETTHDGEAAYNVTRHGVAYRARRNPVLGGWEVWSHRLALHGNTGTVRQFANLTDMESSIKAFGGLDILLSDKCWNA